MLHTIFFVVVLLSCVKWGHNWCVWAALPQPGVSTPRPLSGSFRLRQTSSSSRSSGHGRGWRHVHSSSSGSSCFPGASSDSSAHVWTVLPHSLCNLGAEMCWEPSSFVAAAAAAVKWLPCDSCSFSRAGPEGKVSSLNSLQRHRALALSPLNFPLEVFFW